MMLMSQIHDSPRGAPFITQWLGKGTSPEMAGYFHNPTIEASSSNIPYLEVHASDC
jgi:hypothetical protein